VDNPKVVDDDREPISQHEKFALPGFALVVLVGVVFAYMQIRGELASMI
jgi:hypothetical protein